MSSLQAAASGLTKRNSAEGSKLSAAGLATLGSTDSMQPTPKAEPSVKVEGVMQAVSSEAPQSSSMGVKEEPAAALPMEVDDDAMFQRKPSKVVKPEPSEVWQSVLFSPHHPPPSQCYCIMRKECLGHHKILLKPDCLKPDCLIGTLCCIML